MPNINQITVNGTKYNITIPSGLTEAEQEQIRKNIGAVSESDVDVVSDGTYPEMTVGNATNSQVAQTLGLSRTIDGVAFDGSKNITHFATCFTPHDTKEKVVNLPGFQLVEGAQVTVYFAENSVSSPTLNVNGTGAVPIICIRNGQMSAGNLRWKTSSFITFTYYGSFWVISGGYDLLDKPVGTFMIQYQGEEEPAARFGGSWTKVRNLQGEAYTIFRYVEVSAPPGSTAGDTLMTSFSIPKGSIGYISGLINSSVSDNVRMNSVLYIGDRKSQVKTSMENGGGCSVSGVLEKSDTDSLIRLETYNYRSTNTILYGKLEALVIPTSEDFLWIRTA